MKSIKIINENEKYIGKNIYQTIGKLFPNLSIGNLNKVFRLKDVKVNKTRVSKDYIINKNDLIEIYLCDELLYGTNINLNYIYEDENILAVYKPAKMLSCNEKHIYSNTDKNVYLENLVQKEKGINCTICHRLDTNTEGIVIFAKKLEIANELFEAFKNRYIIKKYLAFIHGTPPQKHDILDAYLLKKQDKGIVKIYDTNVKNSVPITTEYTFLNHLKEFNVSVLEVTLHTGKTHQIRAHLNYIGIPIIGDPKYSTNEINKRYNLKSQALFAYNYTFNFPRNSKLEYLNKVEIRLNTEEIINKVIK